MDNIFALGTVANGIEFSVEPVHKITSCNFTNGSLWNDPVNKYAGEEVNALATLNSFAFSSEPLANKCFFFKAPANGLIARVWWAGRESYLVFFPTDSTNRILNADFSFGQPYSNPTKIGNGIILGYFPDVNFTNISTELLALQLVKLRSEKKFTINNKYIFTQPNVNEIKRLSGAGKLNRARRICWELVNSNPELNLKDGIQLPIEKGNAIPLHVFTELLTISISIGFALIPEKNRQYQFLEGWTWFNPASAFNKFQLTNNLYAKNVTEINKIIGWHPNRLGEIQISSFSNSECDIFNPYQFPATEEFSLIIYDCIFINPKEPTTIILKSSSGLSKRICTIDDNHKLIGGDFENIGVTTVTTLSFTGSNEGYLQIRAGSKSLIIRQGNIRPASFNSIQYTQEAFDSIPHDKITEALSADRPTHESFYNNCSNFGIEGLAPSWKEFLAQMRNYNFFGFKLIGHPTFLNKLAIAKTHLLANTRFTEAELSQIVGISGSRSHWRSTENKSSYHVFGMAVDLSGGKNPWISETDNRKETYYWLIWRAVWLIGNGSTPLSAIILDSMKGETTEVIYEKLRSTNNDVIQYLQLMRNGQEDDLRAKIEKLSSPPQHLTVLNRRRVVVPLKFYPTNITIDQLTGRDIEAWKKVIQHDKSTTLFYQGGNPSGFLNFPLELIAALRDVAGLGWGGVDIGRSDSGDFMHFDMRNATFESNFRRKLGTELDKLDNKH